MSERMSGYRLKHQRLRMVGEQCSGCGEAMFPPRDLCMCCGDLVDQRIDLFTFSGMGEVYSFTTIYDAPAGFEHMAPYTVALVKLDEGPMVLTQLSDIDVDKVEIGMSVEMVTRKLRSDGDEGIILYGYKFRQAIQTEIGLLDRV